MRGKPAAKRKIEPDGKYHNVVIAKFINHIMEGGKKTIAQGIVYQAFDELKALAEKNGQKNANPLELFDRALRNVTPTIEVRSKRVGGANYQIPTPVRSERAVSLAFRWILEASRARKGKPMATKLAQELWEAFQEQGGAMKKKEDVFRMAQANRAFAHFAR